MTEHDATNGAGSQPSKDDSARAREAAWDDVAAQFTNLGKQLRSRFERPAGETQATDATQGARQGPGGETVRRWIDTLDDTFTKLGDTVRDPEFRKEAGSSVSQLGQALGVTLRELGEQLQGRFGRSRTGSATGEDMPDVPPPPPSTPPSSEVPPTPPPTADPSATSAASEVPPPSTAPEPPPSGASDVPPPKLDADAGDESRTEDPPAAP